MKNSALCIALLGTALLASAPVTASFSVASKTSAALLIHHDIPGEQKLESLRATLTQVYGFPSDAIVVVNGRTAEDVWVGIDEFIFETEDKGTGQALIYVSMPAVWNAGDGFMAFAPSGADPEQPWDLVNFEELVKSLTRVHANNMLLIYPSCGNQSAARRTMLPLAYGGRATGKGLGGTDRTVEAISICASEDLARSRRDGSGGGPSSERLVEAAQAINDVLVGRGLDGAVRSFDAGQLADESARATRENGLLMRAWTVSGDRDLGYRFLPQPSELARYQQTYRAAGDAGEARGILFRIASVTRKESEDFVQGAMDLLKEIAISDGAGLNAGTTLTARDELALRAYALEQLARIDGSGPVDLLFDVAEDTAVTGLIRSRAISSLSNRARVADERNQLPEEELARMRAFLEAPDETVLVAAIRAIAQLDDKPSAPRLMAIAASGATQKSRQAAISALALVGDARQQQSLLKLLNDTADATDASYIVRTIGELGESAAATTALLTILDDTDDAGLARSVIAALPKVSSVNTQRSVTRSISRWARHEDSSVGVSAMYALAAIDDDRSTIELRRNLGDRKVDTDVRIAAAESLGRKLRQSGERVTELEAAASAESSELRRAAISALGAIGYTGSAALLEKSLEDKDGGVVREANKALGAWSALNEDQLAAALRSDSYAVRLNAVQSIDYELTADQVSILVSALGDRSGQFQSLVAEKLAAANASNVESGLEAALQSDDVLTRRGALIALGARGTGASLNILLGHDERDQLARQEQLKALGRYQDDRAVKRILEAVSSEDVPLSVQLTAVDVLAAYRDRPDVRRTLEALARSRESNMRRAAIQSLGSATRIRKAPD